MSTALATQNQAIIQSLVLNGDLSKMDANMKVVYYKQYCDRLGLDPFTQPFKILKLNGKEVLYCDRSGTQQLSKLHKVSHQVVARETVNGCYVVTARAMSGDRQTESIGAVTIDNLKGEALCNAMMKAETKAKRRATLDLLGLGILDESETDSIPGATPMPAPIDVTPGATEPAQEQPADTPKQKLGDQGFLTVCTRLQAGELDMFEKVQDSFDLTPKQVVTLIEIYSQVKNAAANGNAF